MLDTRSFTIRPMREGEKRDVAQLIFDSTNQWYESHGMGKIFQGEAEDCLVFCDVYEDLDPGCCLVAVREDDGAIVGSCFYHPRESHVSLGIMNAAAESGCKGVAKTLLQKIAAIAANQGKSLRLVSSAFNLDSFSLYNKQGFAPYAFYQDMILNVPEEGVEVDAIEGLEVRTAGEGDVEAIVALEADVWGASRRKDWEYFIEDRRGIWSVSVASTEEGRLVGVLASVKHPGSNLLGPGVAHSSDVAKILIQTQLNQHRGGSPVFLIPSQQKELVKAMYALGARNCELHLAQSLGPAPEVKGIVLPTFMPETG